MANNFKNSIVRNVSSDETLPHAIYYTPNSKKSIAIELDVANNTSAGVTVSVMLEDEASASTTAITTVTGTNGSTDTVFTASNHGLETNDRVRFNDGGAGTAPGNIVGGAGPTTNGSQGTGKMYYVSKVNNNTFKVGETRNPTTFIQCSNSGTSPVFRKINTASVIRQAPVPVGSSLKVISGQKLVVESDSASLHDKIYIHASATGVDAVLSVLEDVS